MWNILTYSCFLVSIHFYRPTNANGNTYSGALKGVAIRTYRNNCPYSKLCHQDAARAQNKTDIEACCSDCSCSPDCWDRANCCPDVHFPWTKQIVTCTNSFDGGYSYFVSNACPETETNVSLVQACNESNQPNMYLNDMVYVSDMTKTRTFRNRFCAECNGFSDVLFWKPVLMLNGLDYYRTCEQVIKSTKSYTKIQIENPQHCKVISLPLDDVMHESFKCYSIQAEEVCHVIVSPTSPMPFMQTLCQLFNVPFWGGKHFRNVFCRLCDRRDFVETDCPLRDDRIGLDRAVKKLTRLVSFGIREVVEDKNIVYICKDDEIVDVLTVHNISRFGN